MSGVEREKLERLAAAVLILSAGCSFFAAPLMAYGDVALISISGMFLVLFAAYAWMGLQKARTGWRRDWPLVPGIIALLAMGYGFQVAADNYAFTRARCAQLEADMLSLKPLRPDSSILFQALGCKPEGTVPIEFPK